MGDEQSQYAKDTLSLFEVPKDDEPEKDEEQKDDTTGDKDSGGTQ